MCLACVRITDKRLSFDLYFSILIWDYVCMGLLLRFDLF